MDVKKLKSSLRTVPDFPVKGILFWDITTLFKDSERLKELEDLLFDLYKDKGVTKVVGLESRGFIMGSILASRLGAGFVPIRKPGKLPAEHLSESYSKEYGTDSLEIHTDAIVSGDVVLIHDDLLATGGTAAAAAKLIGNFSPSKIYANFIIELAELEGRKALPEGIEVTSVIKV